jgi:oxygen-independent coproporphyrinogen-3 oxidase
VLPLSVYTSLVERLAEVGICGPFEEFTFEANPEDVVEKGEAYIEGLMKLGVNRFSMGVQSFDDGILKWMNRRHDAATARKAYSILENAGAENISIDLIFGLPQLADSVWKDTMDQALDISSKGVLPRHVSSYQLSVEPGSALAKLVDRGVWSEASDELCTRQYDMLCGTLAAAGYHHYEISNFAQPGFEAKHNSAYWAHIPYVGLGPGAHSFGDSGRCRCIPSTAIRQWNNPDLQAYIADPQSVQDHEDLNEEQLVLEKIMLALRTSAGISEDFLRTHVSEEALEYALRSGDLIPSHIPGNLRIPETRFFVSDNIISYLCGS